MPGLRGSRGATRAYRPGPYPGGRGRGVLCARFRRVALTILGFSNAKPVAANERKRRALKAATPLKDRPRINNLRPREQFPAKSPRKLLYPSNERTGDRGCRAARPCRRSSYMASARDLTAPHRIGRSNQAGDRVAGLVRADAGYSHCPSEAASKFKLRHFRVALVRCEGTPPGRCGDGLSLRTQRRLHDCFIYKPERDCPFHVRS